MSLKLSEVGAAAAFNRDLAYNTHSYMLTLTDLVAILLICTFVGSKCGGIALLL